MAVINDFLLKTTIAICIKDNEGRYKPIGTGFFVAVPYKHNKNIGCSFLVTNKHVIENQKCIWIRSWNSKTKKIEFSYIDFKRFNVLLGDDFDIAAISMGINSTTQISQVINLGTISWTMKDFLDNGGYVGTRCFMLGFPLGEVNEENQFPLYRQGCISSIFSKDNKFLLDIQNFPGNSGSPIFTSLDINAIKGSKAMETIKLIGIVNSNINYVDTLLSSQTGKPVELRYENSGLAYALSIDLLRKLLQGFVDKKEKEILSKKLSR